MQYSMIVAPKHPDLAASDDCGHLLGQALHDIRVLHRDMKSANVFLLLAETDEVLISCHSEGTQCRQ